MVRYWGCPADRGIANNYLQNCGAPDCNKVDYANAHRYCKTCWDERYVSIVYVSRM